MSSQRHAGHIIIVLIGVFFSPQPIRANAETPQSKSYLPYVRECLDTLMQYGTDRYGEVHSPLLVSILDIETKSCPENPLKLDEDFRVTRRERRNPAGSNLLPDQPLLQAMVRVSTQTGDEKYRAFAASYTDYVMKNLVDEKGLFWWGWHRHYDVFTDTQTGHMGNHHEIQAIHPFIWDLLWQVNREAVTREIEAIWQWHVIDKSTGEINRHDDSKPGCDFSMTAGAVIEAFTFLYTQTHETVWLDRARLIADYYWTRRHPETNLIPERPNAGTERFDGGSFVTAITGCYCLSLLKCFEMTGEPFFKDQALTYLKAYAEYGYDPETQKFWGALQLNGTPIPGPRINDGYAMYEPRGYLDLWEPYVAGYQFAIATAQCYAYATYLTKDQATLETAKRFADWIERTPTTAKESEGTWYDAYYPEFGSQGTYAEKYGRTISFFVTLYRITGQETYLTFARRMADEAIDKLFSNGLFRGHPAKPYYEAVDGVGFLLLSLIDL